VDKESGADGMAIDRPWAKSRRFSGCRRLGGGAGRTRTNHQKSIETEQMRPKPAKASSTLSRGLGCGFAHQQRLGRHAKLDRSLFGRSSILDSSG